MGADEELSERIAGEIVLSSKPSMTIKKWREMFNLTQKELSEILNISTSVISDYESGRRRSPGSNMIKKVVEAFIEIDKNRGSKIIRAYDRMKETFPGTSAILDLREFTAPIKASELLNIVRGEVVANGDLLDKNIYGYTAMDSLRAILELSSEEFLKIYGLTSERALIFTKVSSGRSPFVAIRVSTLKPGLVILHGTKEVDSLGVKIAEMERIPVVLSNIKNSDNLIKELRNKAQ